jgi:alpha,alpha-trehalase
MASHKLLLLSEWQAAILTQGMHPELSGTLSADLCLRRAWRQVFASTLVILLAVSNLVSAQQPQKNAGMGLEPILSYISTGWDTLSRSLSDCATFSDSKLTSIPQLYLPANFPVPESAKQLESRCNVQVKNLPPSAGQLGKAGSDSIDPPGLLYLQNRYVVPGGRFNEMYGWDSYFIIVGLLRDGRLDLAKGMVDNFLFEVEHYGGVLNANRTYYLTRSQPPFLTSMIMAIYEAQKAAGHEDLGWLRKAYQLAGKEHSLWTKAPHLAGATGLSRYFDFGEGPAPESLKDETGHYREVVAFFLAHPELDHNELFRKPDGATSLSTFG